MTFIPQSDVHLITNSNVKTVTSLVSTAGSTVRVSSAAGSADVTYIGVQSESSKYGNIALLPGTTEIISCESPLLTQGGNLTIVSVCPTSSSTVYATIGRTSI